MRWISLVSRWIPLVSFAEQLQEVFKVLEATDWFSIKESESGAEPQETETEADGKGVIR